MKPEQEIELKENVAYGPIQVWHEVLRHNYNIIIIISVVQCYTKGLCRAHRKQAGGRGDVIWSPLTKEWRIDEHNNIIILNMSRIGNGHHFYNSP